MFWRRVSMPEFVKPVSDLILDKSKINTYLACPFRYKLQYIDNIKPAPTIEISIGKIFHEITGKYYDLVNVDMLKANFINHSRAVLYGMIEDESLKPVLMPLIENFVLYEYERWKFTNGDFELFKPVAVEKYYCCKELGLEGTIDRLFKDAGSHVVLEMKTGEYKPYPATQSALKREVIIYSWLVRLNGIDVRAGCLYFPRNNIHVVYEDEVNDVNVFNRILHKANQVREKIEKNVFPQVKSGLCRFCGYKNICYAHT
jgi:CRISPR/Cas system-associated exonuclease Cas4 (RecB family)